MSKPSEDLLAHVRKRTRPQLISPTPAKEDVSKVVEPDLARADAVLLSPELERIQTGPHMSAPHKSSDEVGVVIPFQTPRVGGRQASDQYEVGYKKPPKSSQFRKGSSGNPKGRPKASKNVRTIVQQTLFKTREVKVDGKTTRLTQFEIGVQQIMNKAMLGDPKAVSALLMLIARYPDQNEQKPGGGDTPTLPSLTDSSMRRLARYQSNLLREANVPENQIRKVLEKLGLPLLAPGAQTDAEPADFPEANMADHDNDIGDDDDVVI